MTTTGTVSSVSGNSLGVTDAAGKVHNFTLDAQTKVTLDGTASGPGSLAVGQDVKVDSDGAKVKRVDATA